MSNRVMYEITLLGGRYCGMVVPVPEEAWFNATVFLCVPKPPSVFVELPGTLTSHGWEGHFYYPEEFSPGGALDDCVDLEDDTVYHRCLDMIWRTLILKRALGL